MHVTITLEREKETKNKVRFSEPGEPHEHLIGTLYVPKPTLSRLGNPARLRLTLTVGELAAAPPEPALAAAA